jgi:hypothetical protein
VLDTCANGKSTFSLSTDAANHDQFVTIVVCVCVAGALPTSNILKPYSTKSIAVLLATGTTLRCLYSPVFIPFNTRIVLLSERKSVANTVSSTNDFTTV